MSTPVARRLYVAAANKSSGKTVVALGLARALVRAGDAVQTFKKGPDYIDPSWLGRAARRPCINLDFHTMTRPEILALHRQSSRGASVALVEGNKGLFDGVAVDGSDSNAALADLLGACVLLVIDTRGMTRGIAPLLVGYRAFAPGLAIGGVVLNQVGGERHEGKLRAAITEYTDVPVLGVVPKARELEIAERHLGLVPGNEAPMAEGRIERIADLVGGHVDLGEIRRIASTAARAGPPAGGEPGPGEIPGRKLTVGIARDEAFGFYYPDDVDRLSALGATIHWFSPLRDPAPPRADALIFGGGFPEVHAERLSTNRGMREAVRRFCHAGGVVLAECGGLMYLGRSLTTDGRTLAMCEALPLDTAMEERPVGRGLVRLRETAHAPWPGGGRDSIPAHEFHHSRVTALGPGTTFAYRVERGHGVDGRHDGIVHHNVLATYAHQRHTAANPWVPRFLAHAARCVEGHGAAPRRSAG